MKLRTDVIRFAFSVLSLVSVAACASPQDMAKTTVKDSIARELTELTAAARALQSAAPAPDADGWTQSADAASVTRMKTEWKRMRVAYERVEGAIAVLFPETDVAIDERYDGFVSERADANLFDGEGVTGMHAIERILWSNEIPERVRTFDREQFEPVRQALERTTERDPYYAEAFACRNGLRSQQPRQRKEIA